MTLLGVRNDSGGVLCGTIVLVGVMRHGSWAAVSMVPGTWPVSCAVGGRLGWSYVFPVFCVPWQCKVFGAFSV